MFRRRRGFPVVLQPLATTLVLEKKVSHSMRSGCPSVLTRPRPAADIAYLGALQCSKFALLLACGI